MKYLTFGELMLRLEPEGRNRFLQTPTFEATFGGGEANVAVSLANFGLDATFITKLPRNPIADAALSQLRGLGVNVDAVARGGDRMGIYFIEKGASMRPAKVVYDRTHSALAEAIPADFDWENLFDGVNWFHFTGITPALSANVAAILKTALSIAKSKNITVSCDLNYRKLLWTREKAREVMADLAPYVDVLIANETDAEDVFNITAPGSDAEHGEIGRNGYEEVAKQLVSAFSFKTVAITLRKSHSADDNDWSALLYTDGQSYFSKTYSVHIVDRVGGGDSFGAGLIYGLNTYADKQHALDFAVAASALKHTIEGDFNRASVDEVERLVAGEQSGRVQR